MPKSTVRKLFATAITAAAAATTFALVANPAAAADPGPGTWSQLRSCESSGNYQATDGAGHFGAYQFDQSTWDSVGGQGRPDQASPAEQDYRALYLYRMRGWQPWECADAAHLNLQDDGTARTGRIPSRVATPVAAEAVAPKPIPPQAVTPRTVPPKPAAATPIPPVPAAPAAAPSPIPPVPPSPLDGVIPPAGSGALAEPALPGIELTYGSCSPVLAQWQLQLNRYGYGLDGSGCFGPKTEVAAHELQYANGIRESDTIGPFTLAAAYVGRAPR